MAHDPEVRRLVLRQHDLVEEAAKLVVQLQEHVELLMQYVDLSEHSDSGPTTSKTVSDDTTR